MIHCPVLPVLCRVLGPEGEVLVLPSSVEFKVNICLVCVVQAL